MKGKAPSLPKFTPALLDEVPSFLPPDEALLGSAVKDVARVRQLLAELLPLLGPGVHQADNFITWGRNVSALSDVPFREAWLNNCKLDSDLSIMWRRYILCTAAHHCVHLPGDFVECGTLWGSGIKTIVDYFGKDAFKKTFWGYDTFDYNPVPGESWVMQAPGFYEEVLRRFRGYNQVQLIKGFLPHSLVGNSPDHICFLHIDLNDARYEVEVLDALFERVVSGGVVVLDDYEWAGMYRAQKIAEDEWFAARGYKVMPFPTGQGLVLKR